MSAKPGALITVLYKRSPDLKFDLDYWLHNHVPFATKLWLPEGLIDGTASLPTEDSEFYISMTLRWTSLEDWEKASKNEETTGKIQDDVKNFANAEALFIVGKIIE